MRPGIALSPGKRFLCQSCISYSRALSAAFVTNPHSSLRTTTVHPSNVPSIRRNASRVSRRPVSHPESNKQWRLKKGGLMEDYMPEFLTQASRSLRSLKRSNRLGAVTEVQALEFFKLWAQVCDASDSQYLSGSLPVKVLRTCVQTTLTDGVEKPLEDWENAVFVLCRLLMHRHPAGGHSIRRGGRRLLATMSAAGSVVATVRMVASAWRLARQHPQVLRRPELAAPLAELKQIVARVEKNPQGNDYQALVLEGKLQDLQGRTKRALELWWRACAAAKTQREKFLQSKRAEDLYWDDIRSVGHLCTPWNDLTVAHNAQAQLYDKSRDHNEAHKQRQAAIAANAIGCKLDDPWAHFNAAEYIESDWDWEEDEPISYSHKYLYHMTKAAASGIVEATYRVAQYYFMATWPYFNDEPPDDIKPTPFDRKPAPGGTVKRSPTPAEEMYITGVQPASPYDRYSLAYSWLAIGVSYGYAPAYKLKAEVALAEDFPGTTAPPTSAVHLKDSRYHDNDPANIDYDRKVSIRPDKEMGKKALVDLCLAIGSVHMELGTLDTSLLNRKLARGISQTLEEDELPDGLAGPSRHFWRWPEVRRSWISKTPILVKGLVRICEEQGWDRLSDPYGNIVYEHGKVKPIVYAENAG